MASNRLKLSLGQGDFVFLDYQEYTTMFTLLGAMVELHGKGYKSYSMTRLIEKAFRLREKEFITRNKLRRVLLFLIASTPRYIHIQQKGNFRIVKPSDATKKKFFKQTEKVEL